MISQGKNTYIIINSHIQKTSYTYDAFGTLVEGDLSGTKDYGYLGKQHDPTANLYNYGYRDYSPSQARFTTVDPIRDGTNWFSYCNGDPVNFVDLWGLFDYELKGLRDDPNHGPDLNFFPHNQRIYDDVKHTPDTPNDYIVAGHGSPNSISDAKGNKMTAKEIADIIKSDPAYDPSMTVWLYSCETGDTSKDSEPIAQEIANELGTELFAPSTFLDVHYYDGMITISKDVPDYSVVDEEGNPILKEPGEWVRFTNETIKGK